MTTTIYKQSPWSLADLFPAVGSLEVEAAFTNLSIRVADFEAVRPQLTADISPEAFLAIAHRLEDIFRQLRRLEGFAGLSFAADTQDQAAQTLRGKTDQFITSLYNRVLFFSLWWKDLDDDTAGRLMSASGDYRYWLEEMRHYKPHTLSEAEEKIINLKNVTGANAMVMLYDSITNRYAYRITVDGEQKELTRGELMVYVRHPDPELRAAAYQELFRIYRQDAPILGQIYQALVRDWRNEQIDLRHYASPMAARNLANDIPDEVVDTLLEVCQRNAVVFQRYFRLKARWLGMPRLRRYDLYAPVAHADKTFDFSSGAEIVLDAFQRFDPQVADLARQVFAGGHIDSEVRKGKRGGAFCWTVTPDLLPWVQLNYQGRADDVATMAHELGHAVHALLADRHNTFTQQASLPLAETASTFGEMVLVDRLLELEKDEAVRRDLLFHQLDDAYATVMRQAYFALFERQAHHMIDQGASLDELAAAYLENLQQQFGEAMEVSDEFRWEWVSIPHIHHVPFYVYAYTFGQLLVLSLYQQYKAEGPAFKPRYLKILAAGGSDAPARILAEAGIDIHSPAFWQGGFDVLSKLVDNLETISVA